MMTAAEPHLLNPPRPSVTYCAILSVVVHAGLLAGLGIVSRSTPTTESVPVIQISLVPDQSEVQSVSPALPPPSLRSASQSMNPPLPPSLPSSQLMTSRPRPITSTLMPPTTHESQELLIEPPKKKVLKDQQAADVLVARTLTKLIKSPSSHSPPVSPPRPSPPKLTTENNQAAPSTLVDPPPNSQDTQASSSLPAQRRVLKDLQATDVLVARTLTKLIKSPSSHSPPVSPPQPSPPKLTTENNQAAQSTLVDPSPNSQDTQASSSLPAQRRVLMARPPGGQTASGSKIGILRFVKPIYPAVAKDAGWEGIVVVRVLVQTNGFPGEVTVKKSSGYSILDKAATEAVQQWGFKPEKDGNIPISKYVDIPLKFELHSKKSRG